MAAAAGVVGSQSLWSKSDAPYDLPGHSKIRTEASRLLHELATDR